MPPKSCSWARIDVRRPNARAVTFGDFEIMAPKSTCSMLTRRGVTSIEAFFRQHTLCLNLCNHTLYRLVDFRQMIHLFSTITFSCFFLSTDNTSSLQSLHRRQFALGEVTLLPPQHSLLGMWFFFDPYFYVFVPLLNAFGLLFPLMFSINLC